MSYVALQRNWQCDEKEIAVGQQGSISIRDESTIKQTVTLLELRFQLQWMHLHQLRLQPLYQLPHCQICPDWHDSK